MRRDVQEIFKMTPQEKQVMMFSATLPKELRVVCKKFMQEVRFLFLLLLLNYTNYLMWCCWFKIVCCYELLEIFMTQKLNFGFKKNEMISFVFKKR